MLAEDLRFQFFGADLLALELEVAKAIDTDEIREELAARGVKKKDLEELRAALWKVSAAVFNRPQPI